MRLYPFLPFALCLCLVQPAFAAQDNAKITLHAQTPINPACSGSDPISAGLPCSQYTTTWPAGTGAFVYLGVGHADTTGIRGLSCGLDYPEDVGIFGWTLCTAGLEFPTAPPGGDFWPASGGGNRITWLDCPKTEIPPDDVHAIAGYFYIYAYDAGTLSITPNNNLLSGPELLVADCQAAEFPVPLEHTAILGFGGGVGYNPCFGGSVVAVDVNPHRCPNKINPKSNKKLQVAILGSSVVRVDDIEQGSILIGDVSPDRIRVQDVSSPANSRACLCLDQGKDGFDDLLLSFPLDEVLQYLEVEIGGDVVVEITGQYLDGNAFSGSDCLTVTGDKVAQKDAAAPDDPNPAPEPGNEYLEGSSTTVPAFRLQVVSAPTEPIQRFSYELRAPSRGGIAVYSVTGRLVDHLVTFSGDQGRHEVQWDASRLPGGVYFSRIEANGEVLATRVVLIK